MSQPSPCLRSGATYQTSFSCLVTGDFRTLLYLLEKALRARPMRMAQDGNRITFDRMPFLTGLWQSAMRGPTPSEEEMGFELGCRDRAALKLLKKATGPSRLLGRRNRAVRDLRNYLLNLQSLCKHDWRNRALGD